MQDSEGSETLSSQNLVAKLTQAGVEEDVAQRLAEIARDHYESTQRPSEDDIRRIVATAIEKAMSQSHAKLDAAQTSRLRGSLEGFLISFAASGLFFMVQDYVMILKKFFMAERDDAVDAAKDQAYKLYEKHREPLPSEVQSYLSSNVDSLHQAREVYRADLTRAVQEADVFENAPLLAICIGMITEEPLFLDTYR